MWAGLLPRVVVILAAIWLALNTLPAAAQVRAPVAEARTPTCRHVAFEDAGFAVCTVDLARQMLSLHWRGPDGQPFAGFETLLAAPEGRGLVMAMNAGMYEEDLSPVGFYVEKGRQLKPANTRDGPGNFHLKPNGVFFVAGGKAGILETRAYLRAKPKADLATQSGPMLVIGGAIHPRITADGPSRKLRNGVGVPDPNHAVFAISDGPVSFGTFARLFRDKLGCPDALFLDGSVSALYAPELGRRDITFRPLGPMIAARPRP